MGERGAEDEAARLDRRDLVDLSGVAIGELADHVAEALGVGEQRFHDRVHHHYDAGLLPTDLRLRRECHVERRQRRFVLRSFLYLRQGGKSVLRAAVTEPGIVDSYGPGAPAARAGTGGTLTTARAWSWARTGLNPDHTWLRR